MLGIMVVCTNYGVALEVGVGGGGKGVRHIFKIEVWLEFSLIQIILKTYHLKKIKSIGVGKYLSSSLFFILPNPISKWALQAT